MIKHVVAQTFAHANETPYTGFFIDPYDPVIRSFERYCLAHASANAALVANSDRVFTAFTGINADSAFFPVLDLKICA